MPEILLKTSIPVDFIVDFVKSSQDASGNWYIEGFAATSDFDLQGDIITEAALQNSVNNLIENSTVLLNHDDAQPIGKTVETKVVKDRAESGLWVKVLISKTVPKIWQQIREGVLNKFSIRGQIVVAGKEFVDSLKRTVNVIKELYLVEVSLVSVPANPKARAMNWYVAKALAEQEIKMADIVKDSMADPVPAPAADAVPTDPAQAASEGTGMAQEMVALIDGYINDAKDEKVKAMLLKIKEMVQMHVAEDMGEPDEMVADACATPKSDSVETPKSVSTDGLDEQEKSMLARLGAKLLALVGAEPSKSKKEITLENETKVTEKSETPAAVVEPVVAAAAEVVDAPVVEPVVAEKVNTEIADLAKKLEESTSQMSKISESLAGLTETSKATAELLDSMAKRIENLEKNTAKSNQPLDPQGVTKASGSFSGVFFKK